MCAIIDVNVLPKVLKGNDKDYEPLHNWIVGKDSKKKKDSKRKSGKECKGKMVYGGTKYRKELGKMEYCLKKVVELKKANKAVAISTTEVDREEKYLEKIKPPSKKVDDHHIVAIAEVSGCRVICSEDQGLHRLLEELQNQAKLKTQVSVYQNIEHKHLIDKRNIVPVCR